jgi:hypothetical protein
MNISKIHITIVDTDENTLANIEQLSEIEAPHLSYNGADDKFQQIMTSELSFNMIAVDESGAFLHLFTGSEKRYKVLLKDHSDVENIIDLWQGWLLPEQYGEIDKPGIILVDFVATDGIGQIKTKYLPNTYYKDVQTVSSIIAECLKLTGSSLNISYAANILNAVVDVTLEDLEINTITYLNDKKEKTYAYDILNDLLTTLGCKLFQWKAQWFIVGINRMHQVTLAAENYDSDGNYVDSTNYNRDSQVAIFEAFPNISIKSPIKTTNLKWDVDNTFSLLPDWIVYQLPYLQEDFDYNVKGWTQTGALFDTELKAKTYSGTTVALPSATFYSIIDSDNFYLSLSPSLTEVQTATNYIETDTVYVNGAISYGQNIDVSIKGLMWFDASVTANVENELFYKNKLVYQIYIDSDVIIENTSTFDTNEIFDFKFTQGSDAKQVEFSVNIEAFPINKTGALKVRLYPLITPATGANLIRVTYTELKITLNDDNSQNLTKTRAINYSTSQDIDLVIGASYNEKMLNKLLINSSIPFTSYTYTIPAGFVEVPFTDYYANSFYSEYLFLETGDGDVDEVVLFFDKEEYFYILNNSDKIYRKDLTLTAYAVTDFMLQDNDLRGYVLVQYNVAVPIASTDTLGILFTSEDVTVTNRNYLLNAWKRYGQTENITYLDALARSYNDVTANPIKMIEGTVLGLYGPLDLLEYLYQNPETYQPIRLDLNLTQGKTDITMIECLNEIVIDYGI